MDAFKSAVIYYRLLTNNTIEKNIEGNIEGNIETNIKTKRDNGEKQIWP